MIFLSEILDRFGFGFFLGQKIGRIWIAIPSFDDLYFFSELPDGDGGYSYKQKIDLLAINMATH